MHRPLPPLGAGIGAFVILASFLTTVAGAADWPQWRGPHGTGHAHPSTPPLVSLPNEAVYLWKSKIGDGLASPVVSHGKLVYLDHQQGKETLHAVDARSGQPLWHREIDDTFKDSQSAAGPRCTPLIDGDRTYAQSCRGTLRCVNTADGQEIWSVHYSRDFESIFTGEKGNAAGATRHGYNGMAALDGDRLITLAGGTNGAGIVCLDKKTGKTLWKSLSESPGYAPPFVAELAGKRQILAFMVGGLVGVDARNGQELWRTPIKTAYARHVTTPVVHQNVAIVSSHQAGTFATQIHRAPDGATVQATVAWSSKDQAMNFSSPVLVGRFLYGLGPSKNIFCQDVQTGKVAWSKVGLIHTSADKAHASFVVIQNHILCLTDTGGLVLFEASPDEYKEKGQLQIAMNNWCSPAYVDGVLYLRDAKELMAVKLQ